MKNVSIAIDIGASNGRIIAGYLENNRLLLEEISRFDSLPVKMNDRLYINILSIWKNIVKGLKKLKLNNYNIESIGIDTWAVDYGHFDKNGNLLQNPYHYRDGRGIGKLKKIEDNLGVSLKYIYKRTGIQFMDINSIYQYYDDYMNSEFLNISTNILFLPDILIYALTGKMFNEYTNATTSQMLNINSQSWDLELLNKLHLPNKFVEIIKPGSIVGKIKPKLAKEIGLTDTKVISVASHDTASAILGTPLNGNTSAYLSCGTWSLLGAEIDKPIINEKSFKYNFTNEGGAYDTIRFLKNITGLWIIQELYRKWNPLFGLGYLEISNLARESVIDIAIDTDDDRFKKPIDMEEAIISYCNEKYGENLKEKKDIVRVAYNGIVNKYKKAIGELEELLGYKIEVLNMIGGGIRDELLCELTSKHINKKLIAGPIEASVIGNLIVQLISLYKIDNIDIAREIIRNSISVKVYKNGEILNERTRN
ncbi:rhamnulokinase [Miniphocaeibacter halophilus]|uniref:Rhamnulokinase n=1 Tax=Miniphocaeibacter halophilus TaxID=2931922 RepID=A0AC61N3W5_9FIRM|nr:rhamnulokinase family protein [Miniphocaeibacter halophilus]QQK09011.1 rhamnulokinase [Miniphocaeibacter halophilus]